MNNASSGVIDASLGNDIQQYISLLEWIDTQIGQLLGITKQREGQISNRETVGGVERATLQSSHITKWLFFIHDDVKKRVLECLLETAKIAIRGRKKKFSYILSDGAEKIIEIDGDEFAECDYGIVVDNSNGIQELNQKLDTLAQAALQNQALNFSTIMKIYSTTSITEKQRMIEIYERKQQQQQEQQQQQQIQLQQQQLKQQAEQQQMQLQQQYQINKDNNETKLLVAQINSQAESQRYAMMNDGTVTDNKIKEKKLSEQVRQFDERMQQQADKLAFEKQKHADEVQEKRRSNK